jgi:hypothetical protein
LRPPKKTAGNSSLPSRKHQTVMQYHAKSIQGRGYQVFHFVRTDVAGSFPLIFRKGYVYAREVELIMIGYLTGM